MIKLQDNQEYLPVYCDMTSEPGAYTLLVTSAHGNWRVDEVKARSIHSPSLSNDYSILGNVFINGVVHKLNKTGSVQTLKVCNIHSSI